MSADNNKTVAKVIAEPLPEELREQLNFDKKAWENLSNESSNHQLYQYIKNDPDKVAKYFTPEEVARYEAFAKKERAINDEAARILVDKGILGTFEGMADYVRYMISKEGQKLFKSKELEYDFFGTGMRKYGSSAEALKAFDLARNMKGDSKYKVNADEMNKFASILKSKTEGLDLFRVHSPLARTLDYSTQFGELLGNRDYISAFQSINK